MTHPPQPNVLFLAHRVPYPPDKGDRIRSFNILKFLSQRAAVHLACLADEPVAPETLEALSAHCVRLAVVPVSEMGRWGRTLWALARGRTATEGAFHVPQLRRVVRTWTESCRFDVVFATASSLTPYLRRPELRAVPAVVDLVDVDSQKWLDYAETSRGPRAWLYRLESRRLRRLEMGVARWARAVTLVAEAEAALYRQFCPDGPTYAVTNGVDLEYFKPQPEDAGEREDNAGCVFVGALDYRPNVDGAVWFCREVWPQVLSRCPRAQLALVGRKPAPEVRCLAALHGVSVVGQVPDVRPYLAKAAVTIVPLRIARGVQNKVLESLAMAKATVASPQPLAGLKAEQGIHLLAATTPAEWVAALVDLFSNPQRRRHLGRAGRRYVEEHHHWERCLAPFAALLGLPANPSAGDLSDLVAPTMHLARSGGASSIDRNQS
jgi:sugar transferase (PEP-CTERM/EpsH1 system associated)